MGNRTHKTSSIAGFPGGLTNYNANDQLATDTYDNDGNTMASNGVGYVYDFENHLVQVGTGISRVPRVPILHLGLLIFLNIFSASRFARTFRIRAACRSLRLKSAFLRSGWFCGGCGF